MAADRAGKQRPSGGLVDMTASDPSRSAYPNTILVFPGTNVEIDLRVRLGPEDRENMQRLGITGAFAVITACNPFGRRLTDAENARRTEALARVLEGRSIMAVPADGVSPDRMHREPGFAAAISLPVAASIATSFDQTALFWYDGKAFWIVEAANPSKKQRLGQNGDAADEG